MSEILLTYIVPVYNTEPYVLKCLQSLVDQGLSPEQYEIIAVDDESTDGTLDVVESFAREHPQVRVLRQPHSGVSSARNLALENARGRFIQFVDSDDYLMGGSMVNIVQRAMDLDLDVQVLNNRMVFPDGTVTVATGTSSSSTEAMTGVEYLKGHSMTPYIWRYLIRREFFEQHHWRFNPSFRPLVWLTMMPPLTATSSALIVRCTTLILTMCVTGCSVKSILRPRLMQPSVSSRKTLSRPHPSVWQD